MIIIKGGNFDHTTTKAYTTQEKSKREKKTRSIKGKRHDLWPLDVDGKPQKRWESTAWTTKQADSSIKERKNRAHAEMEEEGTCLNQRGKKQGKRPASSVEDDRR